MMKVKRPTLLVDKQKVLRNIERIVTKAKLTGTEVYPHFKTHQSLEIGSWFRDEGIDGITVSSVGMAQYFAVGGWAEIYIAFPVNINEIDDIKELAESVRLTVLVNEQKQLTELIKEVSTAVKVKIEVETGASRSGVLPEDKDKITEILNILKNSHHEFDSFYSHFGHTYKASNREEVKAIFDTSYQILNSLKQDYEAFNPKISLGDTPSASVLSNYQDIKSVHAGNYVFYDLTQAQIGVCSEDDIGIALAVPVVSKNRQSLELIVYGGGVHLSKEVLLGKEYNQGIFGKIVNVHNNGWSSSLNGSYVKSISQEHGVIQVTPEVFERIEIGDTLGILPVHSCMTADCMRAYVSINGQQMDHFQGISRLP